MQINKINQYFNTKNVCFKQNASSPKSTSTAETDNFSKKELIEPPVVKINKGIGLVLSDEEIAQINKAKKLPDNLRFMYMNPYRSSYYYPYYEIVQATPQEPATSKGNLLINPKTQFLPEGYAVAKSNGRYRAVKIIDKTQQSN